MSHDITLSTDSTISDSQVRRAAKRMGLRAIKSRAGYSADNRGGYMLVDANRNSVEAGEHFDLSPEEVIEYCRGGRAMKKHREPHEWPVVYEGTFYYDGEAYPLLFTDKDKHSRTLTIDFFRDGPFKDKLYTRRAYQVLRYMETVVESDSVIYDPPSERVQ